MQKILKIAPKYRSLIINNDYILGTLFALILCMVVFWPTIIQHKLPLSTDILTGFNLPWINVQFEKQPFPFPVKNIENFDVVRQMFPWKYLAIQQYSEGKWPLWNPTQLSGTPLAAEFLTGAFYPLNIIFAFLSFNWGFAIQAILQIFVIFLTTWLFLRSIALSRFSSLFGATIFSLSGFVAGFFSINTMVHALSWTPLSLFAVNKIYKTKNHLWVTVVVISISLIGLASHLQILFYSIILVSAYIIFNYLKNKKSKKAFIICFLGIITGILLSSIQLLPSLELLSLSSRSNNYGGSSSFELPIQNFLLLLAPDYLGNPGKQNYFGPISYYHEFSFYVGIPVLFFAFLAAGQFRKYKETLFWIGVIVVCFILTTNNIISDIPSKLNIPIIGSLTPTRAYAYLDLSLAVIGSIGINQFINKKAKHVNAVFVLFMLVVLTCFTILLLNVLHPGMFFWKFLWDTTPSHVQTSLRNLFVPFSIFVMLILMVVGLNFFKIKRLLHITLLALYIISALDLLRQFSFQNGFVSTGSIFPKTAITNYLSSHAIPARILSLEDRILSPNVGAYFGWENIDGYEPNHVNSYTEIYSKYDSIYLSDNKKFGKMISTVYPDSPVIDRLGVDYILTNYLLDERFENDYREIMREGEVILYENLNQTPRFSLSELNNSKQKDTDFLNNLKIIYSTENNNNLKEPSSIEITEYQSDSIKLNINNSGNKTTLQTMIINYPGWEVFVNGQKTKLKISDEDFIGVEVPHGHANIIFKYRPVSFYLGLFISLSTFIILIIFSFLYSKVLKKFKN